MTEAEQIKDGIQSRLGKACSVEIRVDSNLQSGQGACYLNVRGYITNKSTRCVVYYDSKKPFPVNVITEIAVINLLQRQHQLSRDA